LSLGLGLSRSSGFSSGISGGISGGIGGGVSGGFGGGFLSGCGCGNWLRSSGRRRLHESPDHVEAVEVSSGIRLKLDDEVVCVEHLALEPSSFNGVVEPGVFNVAEFFKEVAVVGAVWNIGLDSESIELVDIHAHLSGGLTADDESKMVPLAMLILSWSTRSMSWVSWVATGGTIGRSLFFNVHL